MEDEDGPPPDCRPLTQQDELLIKEHMEKFANYFDEATDVWTVEFAKDNDLFKEGSFAFLKNHVKCTMTNDFESSQFLITLKCWETHRLPKLVKLLLKRLHQRMPELIANLSPFGHPLDITLPRADTPRVIERFIVPPGTKIYDGPEYTVHLGDPIDSELLPSGEPGARSFDRSEPTDHILQHAQQNRASVKKEISEEPNSVQQSQQRKSHRESTMDSAESNVSDDRKDTEMKYESIPSTFTSPAKELIINKIRIQRTPKLRVLHLDDQQSSNNAVAEEEKDESDVAPQVDKYERTLNEMEPRKRGRPSKAQIAARQSFDGTRDERRRRKRNRESIISGYSTPKLTEANESEEGDSITPPPVLEAMTSTDGMPTLEMEFSPTITLSNTSTDNSEEGEDVITVSSRRSTRRFAPQEKWIDSTKQSSREHKRLHVPLHLLEPGPSTQPSSRLTDSIGLDNQPGPSRLMDFPDERAYPIHKKQVRARRSIDFESSIDPSTISEKTLTERLFGGYYEEFCKPDPTALSKVRLPVGVKSTTKADNQLDFNEIQSVNRRTTKGHLYMSMECVMARYHVLMASRSRLFRVGNVQKVLDEDALRDLGKKERCLQSEARWDALVTKMHRQTLSTEDVRSLRYMIQMRDDIEVGRIRVILHSLHGDEIEKERRAALPHRQEEEAEDDEDEQTPHDSNIETQERGLPSQVEIKHVYNTTNFSAQYGRWSEFYESLLSDIPCKEWAKRPEIQPTKSGLILLESGSDVRVADNRLSKFHSIHDLHNHKEFGVGDVVWAKFQSDYWPGYVQGYVPARDLEGDKKTDVVMIRWTSDECSFSYVCYAEVFHFDMYFAPLFNPSKPDKNYAVSVAEAIKMYGRCGYYEKYITRNVYLLLKKNGCNLSSVPPEELQRINDNVKTPISKEQREQMVKNVLSKQINHFNHHYKTFYAGRNSTKWNPGQETLKRLVLSQIGESPVETKAVKSKAKKAKHHHERQITKDDFNPDSISYMLYMDNEELLMKFDQVIPSPSSVPLFADVKLEELTGESQLTNISTSPAQMQKDEWDQGKRTLGIHHYMSFDDEMLPGFIKLKESITKERQDRFRDVLAREEQEPDSELQQEHEVIEEPRTTCRVAPLVVLDYEQVVADETSCFQDPEIRSNYDFCRLHITDELIRRNDKIKAQNEKILAAKAEAQKQKLKEEQKKAEKARARSHRSGPIVEGLKDHPKTKKIPKRPNTVDNKSEAPVKKPRRSMKS